jgi:hypothetical protein
MRKELGFILGGVGFGIAIYMLSRASKTRLSTENVNLTTADIDYSDLSREEVVAEHLIDLNLAKPAELLTLGLDPESLDRLVENRPYRTKLELISRMILPESVYAGIRDKVAVSEGRDPIKVA